MTTAIVNQTSTSHPVSVKTSQSGNAPRALAASASIVRRTSLRCGRFCPRDAPPATGEAAAEVCGAVVCGAVVFGAVGVIVASRSRRVGQRVGALPREHRLRRRCDAVTAAHDVRLPACGAQHAGRVLHPRVHHRRRTVEPGTEAGPVGPGAHVEQQRQRGGGLGVAYTPGEAAPIRALRHRAGRRGARGVRRRRPARAAPAARAGPIVVAQSGVTLYRVRVVKQTSEGTTWVSVDGGMADNLRVALYDASYHPLLATRLDVPATGAFAVAGRHCESGDVLAWDVPLPIRRRATCWRCR